MQSREPGAFVSRRLVLREELVWTQCAMGGRRWIESCMTGSWPGKYWSSEGSSRCRSGKGVTGITLDGPETIEADVTLVQVLMLMLMLGQALLL